MCCFIAICVSAICVGIVSASRHISAMKKHISHLKAKDHVVEQISDVYAGFASTPSLC
jgi:hypothetical protein